MHFFTRLFIRIIFYWRRTSGEALTNSEIGIEPTLPPLGALNQLSYESRMRHSRRESNPHSLSPARPPRLNYLSFFRTVTRLTLPLIAAFKSQRDLNLKFRNQTVWEFKARPRENPFLFCSVIQAIFYPTLTFDIPYRSAVLTFIALAFGLTSLAIFIITYPPLI